MRLRNLIYVYLIINTSHFQVKVVRNTTDIVGVERVTARARAIERERESVCVCVCVRECVCV